MQNISTYLKYLFSRRNVVICSKIIILFLTKREITDFSHFLNFIWLTENLYFIIACSCKQTKNYILVARVKIVFKIYCNVLYKWYLFKTLWYFPWLLVFSFFFLSCSRSQCCHDRMLNENTATNLFMELLIFCQPSWWSLRTFKLVYIL